MASGTVTGADKVVTYRYDIVASYPHDRGAFTQGLLFSKGKLYESTGKYGSSSLREVELASGLVLRRQLLAQKDFGEGLALIDKTLVQLTWTSGHGYLWDIDSFEPRGKMPLLYNKPSRGKDPQPWGLCFDGERLILSDGSEHLFMLDPHSFQPLGKTTVTLRGRPLRRLNELECIDGKVYANIWYSDQIAIINPDTGQVEGLVDLSTLYPLQRRRSRHDVLNGIAWDSAEKRLFITGKHWPKLYHIELRAPAD
ncbi:glutaminyl-peptide cyclotransferase [Halieaceae bacterium IMCC14734]|uniref:Glutaminyl-peptide cyclotransferase n=1 Tax=Candidatus Litorirhabdus singularis TaxID=2518993 RepID=A0ABT3TBS8_9GAMM|nr:glutaminyl-peptide cyclotransferase [Candidatus Litorirhabdus singularis]